MMSKEKSFFKHRVYLSVRERYLLGVLQQQNSIHKGSLLNDLRLRPDVINSENIDMVLAGLQRKKLIYYKREEGKEKICLTDLGATI